MELKDVPVFRSGAQEPPAPVDIVGKATIDTDTGVVTIYPVGDGWKDFLFTLDEERLMALYLGAFGIVKPKQG